MLSPQTNQAVIFATLVNAITLSSKAIFYNHNHMHGKSIGGQYDLQ